MNCSILFSFLFDRLRIGFLSMANVQRIIPFQMYIFVLYLKQSFWWPERCGWAPVPDAIRRKPSVL